MLGLSLVLQLGCSSSANDGFDDLRALPEVASVEVSGPPDAAKTLIHIRDYHYISRDLYAQDFGRDSDYEAFLKKVEQIQGQQVAVLRHLIQSRGVKAVFAERVTTENTGLLHERVQTFRALNTLLAEAKKIDGVKARELEKQTQDLINEGRERLLDLGAGGRLLVEGDQVEVLPLEDEKALNDAKPKLVDGRFTFDPVKTKVREEVMVKNAFRRGSVAVVILGGAHDLTRLLEGCRYVRVAVRGYGK